VKFVTQVSSITNIICLKFIPQDVFNYAVTVEACSRLMLKFLFYETKKKTAETLNNLYLYEKTKHCKTLNNL
jgi:lipid A disaccharide synthetase